MPNIRELLKFKLDLVGMQIVRWWGSGTERTTKIAEISSREVESQEIK
jgi:hypothetical protein